jgi:hypothetical protein
MPNDHEGTPSLFRKGARTTIPIQVALRVKFGVRGEGNNRFVVAVKSDYAVAAQLERIFV